MMLGPALSLWLDPAAEMGRPHLCVPCLPKQEQLNRESERARRAAAECDEARQRAEELSQRVHQAQQDAAARDGVVASLVRGVEGLQRDLARLQR